MTVFAYDDYRKYLLARLGEGQRTGLRRRLSEVLGCQPAHLSQVLNGKNQLSIEHAFGVNSFFGHDPIESDYFLNIVQAERSGTVEAQRYFYQKAKRIKEDSLSVKDRLQVQKRELSAEDQSVYYSDALYLLCHVAVSLPGVKSLTDLARLLDVKEDVLIKVTDFLERVGMLERNETGLTTGPNHTHLGVDSPYIKRHHLNLRLVSLGQIQKEVRKSNLHYASVYTLSRQDAHDIKEKILKLIEENLKTVGPSAEEVMYCNIMDFFEVSG